MSTMSPGSTSFCEVAPVTTRTVGEAGDPAVLDPAWPAGDPLDPVAECELALLPGEAPWEPG